MRTADTPLWRWDLEATVAHVTCPGATVTVRAGGATASASACDGAEPLARVRLGLAVHGLDGDGVPAALLAPDAPVTVSAEVAAAGDVGPVTTFALHTPPAPVWVGLGDSYTSGHHLAEDTLKWDPPGSRDCGRPGLRACRSGTVKDDPGFSWVRHAVDELNRWVPEVWRMRAHVLARSGATAEEAADEQRPAAEALLAGHAGSWNVVSVTGGANDADFAKALEAWYWEWGPRPRRAALIPDRAWLPAPRAWVWTDSLDDAKPWAVEDVDDCPDAGGVRARINTGAVRAALQKIIDGARAADPAVTAVTLTYPHVHNPDSPCFHGRAYPDLVVGSAWVIEMLAAVHDGLEHAHTVHLTEVYTADAPLDYLQLTRFYGYPHPNAHGQEAAAAAAAGAVHSARPHE